MVKEFPDVKRVKKDQNDGAGVYFNFLRNGGMDKEEVGIEGLTGSLAQELPKGLAAVALNPGIIDTGMLRSC